MEQEHMIPLKDHVLIVKDLNNNHKSLVKDLILVLIIVTITWGITTMYAWHVCSDTSKDVVKTYFETDYDYPAYQNTNTNTIGVEK